MDMKTVFSHVDHTLLKPTATWEQIRVICEEGLRFGMASVLSTVLIVIVFGAFGLMHLLVRKNENLTKSIGSRA